MPNSINTSMMTSHITHSKNAKKQKIKRIAKQENIKKIAKQENIKKVETILLKIHEK